jgi:glycosyltransferase involved in cell wall biosynthesis
LNAESTVKSPLTESPFAARAFTRCKSEEIICNGFHSGRSVLLLIDQLCELGGGERAVFQLASGLRQSGFRVFVVTLREDPDREAYRLCEGITVMAFSSFFSLGALRVAQKLRRLIQTEQISIVQTFFESADTFGALVAYLAGVRCIISSRRDMGILRTRKHRAAYRVIGSKYKAVLAVSDEVRRWHQAEDRLSQAQMHTIHNGLTLDHFESHQTRYQQRLAHQLPPDVPLVTTIANINAWKGVDVFIRAAAIVHKTHPEATFAIAGQWTDLDLTASLQRLAIRLGVGSCVHFIGYIRNVAPLLLSSDVFALLSRSEGFPNVVLEAMAARLPVVATRVGGTPEVVQDNATGFLVPNEDAEAAATHITTLLSDEPLRRQLGDAGRQRVEEMFSLDQMIRKHVELYDAFLSQSA